MGVGVGVGGGVGGLLATRSLERGLTCSWRRSASGYRQMT